MNRTPIPTAALRSVVDTVAWVVLASAPWVAVAGMLLGAVDPLRADVPRAARTTVSPVESGEIGTGAMFAITARGERPIVLERTTVRARVSGSLVRTSVVQSFRNDTGTTVEAIYTFPMPDGAAVHAMEMRIGERRIVSVVREREDARRTYVAARQEGRKAALVEQGRPNLFRTSVANVSPGESVEVALDYVHDAARDGDTFTLTIPLTYTPRFGLPVFPQDGPDGTRDARVTPRGVAAIRSVARPRADVEVRLDAGLALEEVAGDSHAVSSRWEGSDLVITPRDGLIPCDRDIVLRWTVAPSSGPRVAVHAERRDDGTYARIEILPPDDVLGPDEGLPTTTLFVLDVSGSMNGPSIHQARAALDAALARLRPEDAFDILTFSDDLAAWRGRFVPASSDEVDRARRFVARVGIRGGTDIAGALEAAIGHPWPAESPDRVARIVFLTDGAVSNEIDVLRTVTAGLGPVRLHTLGIGAAPNRWLMRAMARHGSGLCAFVHDASLADGAVDRFLRRLDRPVLSSPRVTWDGPAPESSYPERIPDLHAGEAITVLARFAPGTAPSSAVLTGTTPTGTVRVEAPVSRASEDASGVAFRWAGARVEALLDRLHEGESEAEVRPAVVAVGLAHGLVTRYTSRVAVETFASATGPPVPVEVAGAVPIVLPRGGTGRPRIRLAGWAALALAWMAWAVSRQVVR